MKILTIVTFSNVSIKYDFPNLAIKTCAYVRVVCCCDYLNMSHMISIHVSYNSKRMGMQL